VLLSSSVRRSLLAFLVLSVLLYPVLIGLLRVVLFNTVQADDYAPYLLYLLGHREGSVPGAPWAYRILSAAAAAPFTLVPPISFNALPGNGSPAYMAAKQALALLSYFCVMGTTCIAAHTAATRFRCGLAGTLLAGILAFVMCQYTAVYALDTPAVLLVSLGVLAMNSPAAFAGVMVLSALANEKVLIVFGLVLAVRLLLAPSRRGTLLLLMPVVLGCVLYGLAVMAFPMPRLEHQTGPGRLLQAVMINVQASVTPRGLLLNVLPVAILLGVALYGRKHTSPKAAPYATRADWLAVPLLLCVAMVASVSLNLGRIVMHAFPLFIGPAALALERQMHAWAMRGRASGD
jgi:hypothetical protein